MNRLDKSYDLVFKNLKIIDGTGAPAFYGDIGIKNDTIMDDLLISIITVILAYSRNRLLVILPVKVLRHWLPETVA